MDTSNKIMFSWAFGEPTSGLNPMQIGEVSSAKTLVVNRRRKHESGSERFSTKREPSDTDPLSCNILIASYMAGKVTLSGTSTAIDLSVQSRAVLETIFRCDIGRHHHYPLPSSDGLVKNLAQKFSPLINSFM